MTSEHSTDPITIRAHVENAAERIGRVWPLYADVAANPLRGFEDRPFHEAVADAEDLLGGRGYPSPDQFRQAWTEGRIDPDVLRDRLREHGVDAEPEATLERMAAENARSTATEADDSQLDRLLSKWLAAFLDQGQAAWGMPNREKGFYRAWRAIAPYDSRIPDRKRLTDLPETATEAISVVLSNVPEEHWEAIFEHHLAALPGWTGYIKQRMETDDGWQDAYPITLADYLAVRFVLARHLRQVLLEETEPLIPDAVDRELSEFGGGADDAADDASADDGAAEDESEPTDPPLAEHWLSAWEETYRRNLLEDVTDGLEAATDGEGSETATADGRPDAQLVFCIDTRSEIIRRHIEDAGNYETHGYAGFFGIPMEYERYESGRTTTSCPAIVDPNYRIAERPTDESQASVYDRWTDLKRSGTKLMKSLKNDAVGAFGFVEVAGGLFAPPMAARTLAPSVVHRIGDALESRVTRPAAFAEPDVNRDSEADDAPDELPSGMTVEEKVICAEAAFDLMGWDEFAPLVVFAGHGSETVNNPYESSIDCGACSGSPGIPNARVLARICNDGEVRDALRERGIEIPEDTVFVAAEHNTTTDEVTLFPDDWAGAEYGDELEQLRADLEIARKRATAERMATLEANGADSVAETERRAADWAEPRPEIGLSGNSAFVIGPHELTAGVDFDGRAFLHTYDPAADPEGEALENIMTGPLVVTKMINAQYYFSAVDTGVYGSGSKITHNAVGKIGVLQGNGGDLMIGLPIQSLYADDGRLYHYPLRQTVLIYASVERVTEIVDRHEELARLFDNGWMSLTVIDPEQDHTAFRYQGELSWTPSRSGSDAESTPPSRPVSADGGDRDGGEASTT